MKKPDCMILQDDLTVCKLASLKETPLEAGFYFLGRTDQEISLVCRTEDAPGGTVAREDGWRGFRVAQAMEFSLVGILAGITEILAREEIPVFAVSTFDTDYILTKREHFDRAVEALKAEGYAFC